MLGADCLTSHDPATGEEYWRWCGLNPRDRGNMRAVSNTVVGQDGFVFVTSPQHNPMHGLRVDGDTVMPMPGGGDTLASLRGALLILLVMFVVSVAIEVIIEGTGFVEEGNIVTFGGIPSKALASTDGGTRITFWVPKEVPSTGEVPPMILDPGEYEVTVTTPSGTSEPVTFILTRGE